MDKNKLRKEISHLIDSIKDHSDNISNYKRIPQLELEMILSKIKKLYEKSIVFNYINEHEVEEQKVNGAADQGKADQNKKEEEEASEEKKDKMEGTQMEYVEHFEEEKVKKAVEESLDHSISKKEPLKNIPSVISDINSKLKEQVSRSSLNERGYDDRTDATIAAKLQRKKIDNLNKAIGTNEKFVFTKELFAGDREAFNQAVKDLDNLNSYEEAEKHINENLAGKYNWDFNLKSVVVFLDLVQRRFL